MIFRFGRREDENSRNTTCSGLQPHEMSIALPVLDEDERGTRLIRRKPKESGADVAQLPQSIV